MLVARREPDLARRRELGRVLGGVDEPLVEEAADHGAAHRAAHVSPLDRRAGMEDGVRSHTGNDRVGARNADDARFRGKQASDGGGVRRGHRLSPPRVVVTAQSVDDRRQLGVAACRRPPLHVDYRSSRCADAVGERAQADVHDVEIGPEQ